MSLTVPSMMITLSIVCRVTHDESLRAMIAEGEHHESDAALDSARNRTLVGHPWLQKVLCAKVLAAFVEIGRRERVLQV